MMFSVVSEYLAIHDASIVAWNTATLKCSVIFPEAHSTNAITYILRLLQSPVFRARDPTCMGQFIHDAGRKRLDEIVDLAQVVEISSILLAYSLLQHPLILIFLNMT